MSDTKLILEDKTIETNSIYIRLITSIIHIITLLIWSVIGLIIYVPLVARLTAVFCGMVIIASFQKIDLSVHQRRLEYAIKFYSRGFCLILSSFNQSNNLNTELDGNPVDMFEFMQKVWVDIIWAIIFWFGAVALFIPGFSVNLISALHLIWQGFLVFLGIALGVFIIILLFNLIKDN